MIFNEDKQLIEPPQFEGWTLLQPSSKLMVGDTFVTFCKNQKLKHPDTSTDVAYADCPNIGNSLETILGSNKFYCCYRRKAWRKITSGFLEGGDIALNSGYILSSNLYETLSSIEEHKIDSSLIGTRIDSWRQLGYQIYRSTGKKSLDIPKTGRQCSPGNLKYRESLPLP